MSMNPDLARYSMMHATVGKNCYLEDFIGLVAKHGIPNLSLSVNEVRALGPKRTQSLIARNNLKLLGMGGGGWFNLGSEQERIDDSKRAIDTAEAAGAEWVLMIAGGMLEGKNGLETARDRMTRSLDQLLDYASGSGVNIAIEPLHPMLAADRSWLVSLNDAAALANGLDTDLSRGLKIVVDAYHVWWDPYLDEGITASADRIASVHLCDWRQPTRTLRNDRAMTGDGVIDLSSFCAKFEKAGFSGPYETEVLSDDWWARDPDKVIGIAKQGFLDCFSGVTG